MLKRFLLAAATYVLAMMLAWVAVISDEYRRPLATAFISSGLVVLCQLVLYGVFRSGFNLRFADPSLTEFQVLLALGWQTWWIASLDDARGTMLVMYVLIMLFGLFQLPPRVFVRCSVLVFCSFSGLNLWEAYQMRLPDPRLAALQVFALFMVLLWLSLYAGYVQAQRQRMRQRRFALQAHQDTLRGMMKQLEELAATDELTGLFNRRHFLRMASRELGSLEGNRHHGLALIDLDHFKRINDVHGHAAGDRVLQAFAEVATACVREGDVLARYGGEEFVLLLPDCDVGRLASACERLREAFANCQPLDVPLGSLSLSVGMTLLGTPDDLDSALQAADQALYRAKRNGRNRCEAAWEAEDA